MLILKTAAKLATIKNLIRAFTLKRAVIDVGFGRS
jgi:hypothetical protein